MKNILLLGIGGTGSHAVDILCRRINALGNKTNNHISALVFDTDTETMSHVNAASVISMADIAGVGSVCERLGPHFLKEWFPCDEPVVKAQELTRGASQWRKKSYLAFMNAISKPSNRSLFHNALERLTLDPQSDSELYIIASAAGGTGSGSLIPAALYARRFLREHSRLSRRIAINAMIALPDIYAESMSPDNSIKVYANAYAIFRELNAINLVTRGYNDPSRPDKRAPVRMRIGTPGEEVVGVLFDSADRRFWTPEAAPFDQVYLLDRIPGVSSIAAHDLVLANSLYTVLCTPAGGNLDSVRSNTVTAGAQSNGSDAIYAGISSSDLVYPEDTILRYLAYEKVLAASREEWMVLHGMAEAKIKEKEMRAKASRRRFMLADGDYADIYLSGLRDQRETPTSTVAALVDRATACYDEKGVLLPTTTVDRYFSNMSHAIENRVENEVRPTADDVLEQINSMDVSDRKSMRPTLDNIQTVANNAQNCFQLVLDLFQTCNQLISESTTGMVDAILPLNMNYRPDANKDLSLAVNILQAGGKYLHPVTAMVQLCRFKRKLLEKLKELSSHTPWEPFNISEKVRQLPGSLMNADESAMPDKPNLKESRSTYASHGSDRLVWIAMSAEEYANSKTDPYTDNAYVVFDFSLLTERVISECKKQFQRAIYEKLSGEVDLVIDKYRTFFTQFGKGQKSLEERVKMVLKTDCGVIDSTMNVYSDEKAKKQLLKDLSSMASGETEKDVIENEDSVGKAVFSMVYKACLAAANSDDEKVKPVTFSVDNLFDSMVEIYQTSLRRSDAYETVIHMNVVEAALHQAIMEGNADIGSYFRTLFARALDLARPALKVDHSPFDDGSPTPTDAMAVMMSTATATYIQNHLEELKLTVPVANGDGEAYRESCAESFVRTYSGEPSLKVMLVDDISDEIIYFTGEVMGVDPVRISKLNELNPDSIYYNKYTEALARMERFHTDMWNPHLGFNLHHRGCLPPMNPAKETANDLQLTKALLFGMWRGGISYSRGGTRESEGFRYHYKGQTELMKNNARELVTRKNISGIMEWLRGQETLIIDWSNQFDLWFEQQVRALVQTSSGTSDIALKGSFTRSEFMDKLQTCDFLNPNSADSGAKGNAPVGVLGFARELKHNEETERDIDDAERVMRSVYTLFTDFIGRRVSATDNPMDYMSVYTQQVEKFFEAYCNALKVAPGEGKQQTFESAIEWLSGQDLFLTIDSACPYDKKGALKIDLPFTNTEKYRSLWESLKGADIPVPGEEGETGAANGTAAGTATGDAATA